ncbi:hypothetical protein MTO96_020485 [Rhipicephalus appendiculatus]
MSPATAASCNGGEDTEDQLEKERSWPYGPVFAHLVPRNLETRSVASRDIHRTGSVRDRTKPYRTLLHEEEHGHAALCAVAAAPGGGPRRGTGLHRPSPNDGGDDDELTERQTLSKDATVLCRTSPRGKNDPNVRGFAYTVCVNRECMQAGTSKDMQTCTTIFNQSRRKFKQLFNFRVEAGVISACRLRCYNPNTAESLRVNRDDGERCQNRLYEGTCRGGVCRSPNEAIAAIGSVIPIPYQEANAFSNPNDQNVEVEEPGFGEEFATDGFHTDRLEEGFGGRPLQTRFPAVPVRSATVPETNGTLIA